MTTQRQPVDIRLLPTGVSGLDTILGGGIPELSFNLIAGGPGTGKTTLAMRIAFANATVERPALVFTVLGETTLKMLRYQQQFGFFDPGALGSRLHLINLAEEVVSLDLDLVLARISADVEARSPSIVIVDSFRTVLSGGQKDFALDHFVQRLALKLTAWEVTSFLIGEYRAPELNDPVFTVADGVLWLTQAIDRNSVARKIQVVKQRGAAPMPGLHTYRIGANGVEVYPRLTSPPADVEPKVESARVSTGIAALDVMMGGGIPAGDAVIVAGPTGTGKTTMTSHFLRASADLGEAAVLVVFEEFPSTYVKRMRRIVDVEAMKSAGLVEIIYLRPLDLSVDETLAEIRAAVERIGAVRVVIDSLTGFEVALAPTYREDFAESLYRLVGATVSLGVTVMMTIETLDSNRAVRFKNDAVSFLTDDIIVQRYVEIDAEIKTVLEVLKMRGSAHSHDLRLYTIGETGIELGEVPRGYVGVTTGTPRQNNAHATAVGAQPHAPAALEAPASRKNA